MDVLSACSSEETFIIIVVTNPKPRNRISFKYSNRTITPCYPHRPNVFLTVDALEVQRGMKGILRPQPKGFLGPTLDAFLREA